MSYDYIDPIIAEAKSVLTDPEATEPPIGALAHMVWMAREDVKQLNKEIARLREELSWERRRG